MTLRKIHAGVYETEDGKHRLIRTEWDGPMGGRIYLWEHAMPLGAGWEIPGDIWEWTLRDARRGLATLIINAAQEV